MKPPGSHTFCCGLKPGCSNLSLTQDGGAFGREQGKSEGGPGLTSVLGTLPPAVATGCLTLHAPICPQKIYYFKEAQNPLPPGRKVTNHLTKKCTLCSEAFK